MSGYFNESELLTPTPDDFIGGLNYFLAEPTLPFRGTFVTPLPMDAVYVVNIFSEVEEDSFVGYPVLTLGFVLGIVIVVIFDEGVRNPRWWRGFFSFSFPIVSFFVYSESIIIDLLLILDFDFGVIISFYIDIEDWINSFLSSPTFSY